MHRPIRSVSVIGILAATLTYGCVRDPAFTTVMLPNGAVGSVVNCRLKAECFQVASHACHGPYMVVQINDQPTNDFTSSQGKSEYVIQCSSPTKSEVSNAQAQE